MKLTYLYIVGCNSCDIPPIPFILGDAPYVCMTSKLLKGDYGWRPHLKKAEREHTPPALAIWLVALAEKCRKAHPAFRRPHVPLPLRA